MVKELAKETILNELNAIQSLIELIDDDFEKAVNLLHHCKGRVVISGIGKSAIIAQKISATFNSTGTAAIFMHAADAIHGDLGMIQPEDVVIVISKSGESPEIKALIPLIKNFGNAVIAICGNTSSYLATHSDCLVNATIDKEACPNNLAPTTSTTVQMVLGDALAVCLLQLKGFTANDFAKFHPGGALGKRLYLTAGELCSGNNKPTVQADNGINDVIIEISGKRLGATVVLLGEAIIGIITDGDLRRMLQKNKNHDNLLAKDICSPNPKSIEAAELAVKALEVMRQNNISQLVVTENGAYCGMIHLHDLIKEGLI